MYEIIGELSDNQDFTLTTTEEIVSENEINLGIDDMNFGNGELWLNIKVSEAFTTAQGSPSTTITLRTSSDSTISSADTAVITIAA